MLDRSHISAIKPSDLPVPPQAAIQIMHACSREDVNNKEISHLAATDPVITAELLRIVNSSFFALPKQVQSVPHARIPVAGVADSTSQGHRCASPAGPRTVRRCSAEPGAGRWALNKPHAATAFRPRRESDGRS